MTVSYNEANTVSSMPEYSLLSLHVGASGEIKSMKHAFIYIFIL